MYPVFLFVNILSGLFLSLVIGWVALRLAVRFGLMDTPGILPHKQHSSPTPLAGGITFVVTLALSLLLLNFDALPNLYPILLPALLIFSLGLWDDFRRLSPKIKLIGQIAACILLMFLGVSVRIFKPDMFGSLAYISPFINGLITFVWVIGITNAFNFIDSMDGLAVGVSGIAIAFLILVTLASPQTDLLRLLTLMIGTCVGLFFFNMTPARFFLGDSGAQTLGFLLAAIGIVYTPVQYPQASSWFLPILILGVPIFDTSLVVFSRWRRGMPIYRAGHDHTYHRLVASGLDSAHAVAVMHIAAIVLGCIAFVALSLQPLYSNLLFGLAIVTGLAAFLFLDKKNG
jgi:UDP-GlcNAc:undecaprenyl-phosphate/decaprenyl-phosphate GlcNAc-1-phosphate transferase